MHASPEQLLGKYTENLHYLVFIIYIVLYIIGLCNHFDTLFHLIGESSFFLWVFLFCFVLRPFAGAPYLQTCYTSITLSIIYEQRALYLGLCMQRR